MAKFLYQAKNQAGHFTTGQIEAIDENDARIRLKSKNLTVTRIVRGADSGVVKMASSVDSLFQKRVTSRDLQIFARQFATLINAGIPIVDSLKMLGEGKREPLLKDAAIFIRQSIESGKRLGEAMAAKPQVFDRFFINMVKAGEEAGILDEVLARLSSYLEKSEKVKKQVRSAMIYPAAIIVVAIIVVLGILVFIIPRFQELYSSAGKQLPMVTQLVVGMSQFVVGKWYVLLAAGFGIPTLLSRWYQTEEGRDSVDRFLIRAPLFGDLVQKAAIAKMTRTLSTLLSSGVGVVDALEIAGRTAGNRVVEEALIRCKDSVISGKPLANPLAREPMIPPMVSQMIAVGEKSGTLDTMLAKIADFYEDDVENAVKALTSLIEPILMVILGAVIAFLVTAMYLPIFDMASVAGNA